MFRRKSRAQSTPASSVKASAKEARRGLKAKTRSVPANLKSRRVKGIMKYVTEDESIHSKYGETEETDSERERRKGIEFKEIQIREYARTIGDNPSCSSGPPISIAWEFDPETKIISVDQYEESRPPRRTHFEMVLPRDVRQKMLRKEWDVTQAQIASAVRANIRAKNQRRATVNNLGKATRMEEMMENAGKKMMRGLLLKRSTSKEVEKLQDQLKEAEIVRKQHTLEEQMKDEYLDDDEVPTEDALDEIEAEEKAAEEKEETKMEAPIANNIAKENKAPIIIAEEQDSDEGKESGEF